jgi:hypothetical protein
VFAEMNSRTLTVNVEVLKEDGSVNASHLDLKVQCGE